MRTGLLPTPRARLGAPRTVARVPPAKTSRAGSSAAGWTGGGCLHPQEGLGVPPGLGPCLQGARPPPVCVLPSRRPLYLVSHVGLPGERGHRTEWNRFIRTRLSSGLRSEALQGGTGPGALCLDAGFGGALGGLRTQGGSCVWQLQRLLWRLLAPREARVEALRRGLSRQAPPCVCPRRAPHLLRLPRSEGPSVTSGSLCALTEGQLQATLAPKTQGPQPGTRRWECSAPLTMSV